MVEIRVHFKTQYQSKGTAFPEYAKFFQLSLVQTENAQLGRRTTKEKFMRLPSINNVIVLIVGDENGTKKI